jgi:hypothetical protein
VVATWVDVDGDGLLAVGAVEAILLVVVVLLLLGVGGVGVCRKY